MTNALSEDQIEPVLAYFQAVVDEGTAFADGLIKKHQQEAEGYKEDHDRTGQHLHETIVKIAKDYKKYLAEQTTAYRKIVESIEEGMDDTAKKVRGDVVRETERVGEYVTYLEEEGHNDIAD